MMVMAAAERLCQILNVGQLAALGSGCEIRGEAIECGRRGSVAIRLSRLRGALQVGRDLLRNLLIFRRIRLLKLLQSV